MGLLKVIVSIYLHKIGGKGIKVVYGSKGGMQGKG